MARELAPQLPKLLENRVDGDVSWEVPVVVDPLTGTDREAPEILDVRRERMLGEGWDLAICLTDLPVYRDGTLVAADVSAKRGVAGLSLPAMGAMRLRPKARDLTSSSRASCTREPRSAVRTILPIQVRSLRGRSDRSGGWIHRTRT